MGKVKYSIKTTDGNRFEFERDANEAGYIYVHEHGMDWLAVYEKSTIRYFHVKNIVSITKRNEDEES